MRKRGLGILAAAGAAAAATAVAIVTTAGASADQTTRVYDFVVSAQGRTSFVDNPPKTKGKFDPRPGDTFSARGRLFDAAGNLEIGRVTQHYVATVRDPLTFQCQIVVLVNDGQIVISGVTNPLSFPWNAPIVGGTGPYTGAGGFVDVTSIGPQRERWLLSVR